MLRLKIVKAEGFDEEESVFVATDVLVLELEHSLLSLSKWESKWQIPFLSTNQKTDEQVLDYVRMMSSGTEISDETFAMFTAANYTEINDYINTEMTATRFKARQDKPNHEIVTAELIYYWMIALEIPFECQFWHLSRLLALIKVCNIKNQPAKKMNRAEAALERQRLNDLRRKESGSKG